MVQPLGFYPERTYLCACIHFCKKRIQMIRFLSCYLVLVVIGTLNSLSAIADDNFDNTPRILMAQVLQDAEAENSVKQQGNVEAEQPGTDPQPETVLETQTETEIAVEPAVPPIPTIVEIAAPEITVAPSIVVKSAPANTTATVVALPMPQDIDTPDVQIIDLEIGRAHV